MKTKSLALSSKILRWLVFSIIAIGAYHVWNSRTLSASNASQLTGKVAGRYAGTINRQKKVWQKQRLQFTDEMARAQKQKMRVSMLESGASANEVVGVLKSFDNVVATKTNPNSRAAISNQTLYLWLHYAEKGYVTGKPVWIFECGWEIKDWVVNNQTYPGHYWRFAINSMPPYDLLHSENCM